MKLVSTLFASFALSLDVWRPFIEADGNIIDELNVELRGSGLGVQIHSASLYTNIEHADQGRTIFASDVGNKQLSYQWAPFDPNRSGRKESELTWTIDKTEATSDDGITSTQSIEAFFAAASTWNEVTCSEIPIEYVDAPEIDLGYIQWLLGLLTDSDFGGTPVFVADITHGGILPGAFFDALAPGGSNFILGVAFTLTWTSSGDKAFAEIYYNDNFSWSTSNPATAVDLETVALHEMGHALGQAHFGTIAINGQGKVIISPRAVMNAAYTGLLRDLQGSDIAGHCSIWGDWPNN